jgi:hypothetical protein
MIKHIHSDIYAVKVPVFGEEGDTWSEGTPLPPGQWKYLCLSTTQKEEEAALVLHDRAKKHEDQLFYPEFYKGFETAAYFETALESLSSMNKAFELSGTWALIQKEK